MLKNEIKSPHNLLDQFNFIAVKANSSYASIRVSLCYGDYTSIAMLA